MKRVILSGLGLVVVSAFFAWWLLVPGKARPLSVPAHDQAFQSVTPLKSFTPLQAGVLLKLAGLEGISASNTLDTYAVYYASHDGKGNDVLLSGLLAVPRIAEPVGLISWQHGTTSNPDNVPSNLSIDGLAAAILFAGRGQILVAPDYPGLGVSRNMVHPYLIAKPAALAVVDLLQAASRLDLISSQTRPFLVGFSQGAHASLAAQRKIEAEGGNVLGTAAVAGGNNLRTISLGRALEGGAKSHSLYLGYMALGYAAWYEQDLNTLLSARYIEELPRIFGSGLSPQEIKDALPQAPRTLFNAQFLEAFDLGGEHWLLEAVMENEVADWKPLAPVRLYYGENDKDVTPADALRTRDLMTARGGDATAINVGPFDHDPSLMAALPKILAWYDTELRGNE